MDIMEALLTRRSVRKYTGEPVSKEQVEQILKAAMYAPTAANQQTWRFVVINDKDKLRHIPEILPYGAMAADSAVCILVCADPEDEKHTQGYLPQDAAAACQNILLAAHGLGLGAVWCGVHPRPDREQKFREFLNIPEYIIPMALICIGHPDQQAKQPDRFDPDKVHHNEW